MRTITFTRDAGRTTLTIRAEFASAGELARAASRGFRQGTEESFDRLAEAHGRANAGGAMTSTMTPST